MAEAVLDLVQVFDQQIPLARFMSEQSLDFFQRAGIDAAALRRLALALLGHFDLQHRDGDDLAVHQITRSARSIATSSAL